MDRDIDRLDAIDAEMTRLTEEHERLGGRGTEALLRPSPEYLAVGKRLMRLDDERHRLRVAVLERMGAPERFLFLEAQIAVMEVGLEEVRRNPPKGSTQAERDELERRVDAEIRSLREEQKSLSARAPGRVLPFVREIEEAYAVRERILKFRTRLRTALEEIARIQDRLGDLALRWDEASESERTGIATEIERLIVEKERHALVVQRQAVAELARRAAVEPAEPGRVLPFVREAEDALADLRRAMGELATRRMALATEPPPFKATLEGVKHGYARIYDTRTGQTVRTRRGSLRAAVEAAEEMSRLEARALASDIHFLAREIARLEKARASATRQLALFEAEALPSQKTESVAGKLPTSSSGVSTLGIGIRTDFRKRGWTDIRGKKVDTHEDVAAAMQPFRNPQFEFFHLVVVRNGEIWSHEAFSSKLPSTSAVAGPRGKRRFLEAVRAVGAEFARAGEPKTRKQLVSEVYRRAAARKAAEMRLVLQPGDDVYIVHNHPSGIVKPSQDDLNTTGAWYRRTLRPGADMTDEELADFRRTGSHPKAERAVRGHVIIDDKDYVFIDPSERVYETLPLPAGAELGAESPLQAELPHWALGRPIGTAADVAKIAKMLKRPGNEVPILFRSGRDVRAVESIPVGLFTSKPGMEDWLRGRMLRYGSSQAVAYYRRLSISDPKWEAVSTAAERLIDSGWLLDMAVDQRGRPVASMAETVEAGQRYPEAAMIPLYRVWEEQPEYGQAEASARRIAQEPPEEKAGLPAPPGPSYMRVTTPEGQKRIVMGLDPRVAGIMGNKYAGSLLSAIVKEALQNAVDAVRPLGTGKVRLVLGPDYLEVSDSGIGMTPDDVAGIFVDAFASGKAEAEGTTGSFGAAKLLLFSNAKRIQLGSVARDEASGGLLLTTLDAVGADIFDPEKGWPEPETRPAEPTAQTGTWLRLDLDEKLVGLETYQAERYLEQFLRYQRTPFGFDFWRAGARMSVPRPESGGWEKPSGQLSLLTKLSTPEADIDVYAGTGTAYASYIHARVLNHGLPQFQTGFTTTEAELPDGLVIDVKARVPATSPEYPFTIDRQSLRGPTKKAVDDYVEGALYIEAHRRDTARMSAALKAAPKIFGTRFLMIDTSGATELRLLEELAQRPYVARLARTMSRTVGRMQRLLGARVHKSFALGRFLGISTAMEYHGLNVPGQMLGLAKTRSYIVQNPYATFLLVQERGGLSRREIAEELAGRIAATSLHEVVHNYAREHGGIFAAEMTKAIGFVSQIHASAKRAILRELEADDYATLGRIEVDAEKLRRFAAARGDIRDLFRAAGVEHAAEPGPPHRPGVSALGEARGAGLAGGLPPGRPQAPAGVGAAAEPAGREPGPAAAGGIEPPPGAVRQPPAPYGARPSGPRPLPDLEALVDNILTEPAPPSPIAKFVEAAKGFPRRLQRTLVSEFTPLRLAERDVYSRAGLPKPRPGTDMARIFELVAGAPGAAEVDVLEFEKAMEPVVPNAEAFERYLFLRRAKDRLETDPEKRKIGNLTVEETDLLLGSLERRTDPSTWSLFEAKAGEFVGQLNAALRLQVDSGRMAPELYDDIRFMNDFYAPFAVLKDLEEQQVLPGTGRRIATRQQLTQAITGIEDETALHIGSILRTAAQQIYRSRILAEKNFAMLELDALADIDPTGETVRRVKGPAFMPPRTPGAQGTWILPPQPGQKGGQPVPEGHQILPFLKGGENWALVVPDEVAEAVQGLNRSQTSLIGQWLRLAAAPLRAGATTFNISFQPVNLLFADMPRLAMVSKYGLRDAKDLYRFPLDMLRGFMSSVRSNMFDAPDGLYLAMLQAKALNSTVSRELRPEAFQRRMGLRPPPEGAAAAGWRRTAGGLLDTAARMANAIEETTKLATGIRGMRIEGVAEPRGLFRGVRVRDLGRLRPGARARAMREIATEVRNYGGSPDFLRHGSRGRDVNVILMFFNARLQGTAADYARMAGAFTGEDRKASFAAWIRLAALVGLPALFLALWNRDPEHERDYLQNSSTDRENYFFVPRDVYFTDDEGHRVRDYWRIPKREIVKIFGNAIEAAVEFAYKADPEAVGRFAMQFLDNVSPVPLTGRTAGERSQSALSALNPLIQTPLELATGTDFFFHRPIVPERMAKAPSEMQYRRTTPEIYKTLGRTALARAAGLSPLEIEQALGGATAGMFTQFAPYLDLATGRLKAPEGRPAWTALPPMRRFVRSAFVSDEQEQRALAEAEEMDAGTRLERQRDAEVTLAGWRDQGLDPRTEMRKLGPSGRMLADRIARILREEQRGITFTDRRIRALGVESGARAAYIRSAVLQLSGGAKERYLADLRRKRILTPEVERQIRAAPPSTGGGSAGLPAPPP